MSICSICLHSSSDHTTSTTVTTPCNHVFHTECLDKWIARDKRTCPMCREVIHFEPIPLRKIDKFHNRWEQISRTLPGHKRIMAVAVNKQSGNTIYINSSLYIQFQRELAALWKVNVTTHQLYFEIELDELSNYWNVSSIWQNRKIDLFFLFRNAIVRWRLGKVMTGFNIGES